MCFDAKTSFGTGIFTVICSLLLISDVDNKYAPDNQKLGYFFIYVSLVQFLEGFMWLDQGCRRGLNLMSTRLIRLIVYLQPLVVYLIFGDRHHSRPKLVANIIYTVWALYLLSTSRLEPCSRPNREGHLGWNAQLQSVASLLIPYFALFIWNLYGGLRPPMNLISILSMVISFGLSRYFFDYSIGEMWCFFGCLIPLLIFLISKLWTIIDNNRQ